MYKFAFIITAAWLAMLYAFANAAALAPLARVSAALAGGS